MAISKHLPEQPYLLSHGEDQHMASESRSVNVTDTASLLVSKGLNILINYSYGFKPGEFSESHYKTCTVCMSACGHIP